MKVQLAYKLTGEDREKVIGELKGIIKILEDNGHEVYCPVLDKNTQGLSKADSIRNAFHHLNSQDALIAWVKSSDKSEGMLLEVGYSFDKVRELILAVQKDVDTSLRDLANRVIEYGNYDELKQKLKYL